MAIVANISLADGQATPVNHTFNYEKGTNDVVYAVDRSGGVVIAYPRISIGVKQPSKLTPDAIYRVNFRVEVPTLADAVSGVLTGLKYVGKFFGQFDVPISATAAEKANLWAYAKNFTAHTTVETAVKLGEPVTFG